MVGLMIGNSIVVCIDISALGANRLPPHPRIKSGASSSLPRRGGGF